MKVELVRVDDAFHFESTGSSDAIVHIDGSPEIGGHNAGVRPMELRLASCSAIDIVMILKKQRQQITDFRIVAEGERAKEPDTERKPYRTMHLHFKLKGIGLDEAKVARAVKLSMEKYCSATAQFENTVQIGHQVTIEEA